MGKGHYEFSSGIPRLADGLFYLWLICNVDLRERAFDLLVCSVGEIDQGNLDSPDPDVQGEAPLVILGRKSCAGVLHNSGLFHL